MHNQPVQAMTNPSPSARAAALILIALSIALLPAVAGAQQSNAQVTQTIASTAVPTIIQLNGQLSNMSSGATSRAAPSAAQEPATVSITFTLYEAQQGGAPLWAETQNVQVDAQGRYTVLLGSTTPNGLPLGLFTSGQAHWLAIQPLVSGAPEEPRTLLVGVPYAMKAADADTLGGLPASAFVTVQTPANAGGVGTSSSSSSGGSSSLSGSSTSSSSSGPKPPVPLFPAVTGLGAANYIPIWTTAHVIHDSILYQAGANVGIATTTPAALLEVNGNAQFDANVTLPQTTGSSTGVLTMGIYPFLQYQRGHRRHSSRVPAHRGGRQQHLHPAFRAKLEHLWHLAEPHQHQFGRKDLELCLHRKRQ